MNYSLQPHNYSSIKNNTLSLFVLLLFFIISGTMSAQSLQFSINNLNDLLALADSLDNGVDTRGWRVEITDTADMSGSFDRIIGDDINYFQGHFDGNGHTIHINLTTSTTTNRQYVGLFSQATGNISNLTVDGSIVIGDGNIYVGGICGKIGSAGIRNCSNLADIFCGSDIPHTAKYTGGIAGESLGPISFCTNNGMICGGQYTGGIVGRIEIQIPNDFHSCGNSGNVFGSSSLGHNGDICRGSFIGGIAGYISCRNDYLFFNRFINIGHISGFNYDFVGGVAGYLENHHLFGAINSGMVDGGDYAVGGIVGFIDLRSSITQALNTNKISPFRSSNFGAIVGISNGNLVSCFFDWQQSCVGDSLADSLATNEMLGNNLWGILDTSRWVFSDNLYPRFSISLNSISPVGSISIPYLSSAPVYLSPGETIDCVVSRSFFVSNENQVPTSQHYIPFKFQWWGTTGIIDIQIAPDNEAMIRNRPGQDFLRVILNDDETYKKIIPIIVP